MWWGMEEVLRPLLANLRRSFFYQTLLDDHSDRAPATTSGYTLCVCGREEGREREREGGRERKGEGGREEGRKQEREGGKVAIHPQQIPLTFNLL